MVVRPEPESQVGRRGVHEAAAGPASDLRSLLGQAYVSPEAARATCSVLDRGRARTLSAWLDELIPATGEWPSASSTDAVGYIDATAARVPAIRPALLQAVDALEATALARFDTAFAELAHDQRYELLTGLEADNPRGAFDLVLELTYEAYYRDLRVLDVLERRTGFSMRRTMEGWDMEPFDERLLERVRALPPRVRSVPA
jgi:Gluconate 2-dehydrogenase subunit 3